MVFQFKEDNPLAPSFSFLYGENPLSRDYPFKSLKSFPYSKTDRGIAYVGANTGFLPPSPIAELPRPYHAWEAAAVDMRNIIEDGSWFTMIDNLPNLSCKNLPDDCLPLANMCLGTIAHGLVKIASMQVPAKIMDPWMEIASRLGTKSTSLPYLHMVCFNFKSTPPSAQITSSQNYGKYSFRTTTPQISDPWTQTKPAVTLTGSTTEINFWRGTFNVEHASQPIPGRVARVQQAVIAANNGNLRKELIGLIRDLERMTTAFLSVECRHYSGHFMDQIEFARIIDAAAQPIMSGENVASGTQSPTVHLMDAFFASNARDCRLKKSMQDESDYFPKLHVEFLDSVRQVSALNYIEGLTPSQEKSELMHLYSRALESFAGDSGFLGIHLRRLYGFTEIGIKVGRVRSASGLPFSAWKGKSWYHVDRAMRKSRDERMDRCDTMYHTIRSVSSVPQHGGDGGHVVTLDTNGSLIYQPGDVFAALPENNNSLVMDTLQALHLDISDEVPVQSKAWVQTLADRGVKESYLKDAEQGIYSVPVTNFLRYAGLQPMTKKIAQRLIDAISSENLVLDNDEDWHAFYLPAVIDALQKNDKQGDALLKILESVFEPLRPRHYSIASTMRDDPRSLQVIVGKVQYEEQKWDHESPLSIGEPQNVGTTLLKDDSAGQSPNTIVSLATDAYPSSNILPDSVSEAQRVRMMKGISSSFLASRAGGDVLRARVLPELRFRVPEDPNVPIIMICLGTGVAPFVSFLRELIHEKYEKGITRKAWLIMGAKTPGHIPFLEEIEEAVCKEKVAQISFAFSRADVGYYPDKSTDRLLFTQGSRMHVQDVFKNNPTALRTFWDMIIEGGHVYTCGKPDLEVLVRDIVCRSAQRFGAAKLRSVFPEEKNSVFEMSKEYVKVLAAQDRLHISSYNSGKQERSKEEFTPSEIARHRTMSSAYFIFNDSVFDFTEFLQMHPGGSKLMLDKSGRDMTSDFNVAHGSDPLPCTAMMDPYKIGELCKFNGRCDRMKKFMWDWSVPLLHEVLEHESVFMMDVNDFPELEIGDHAEWKSHVSSKGGMIALTNKFWDVHENGLHTVLKEAMGPKKLGEALKKLDVKVAEMIDCEQLQEDLSYVREASVSSARVKGLDLTKKESKAFLRKGREFIDHFIDAIADMQQEVERALELSDKGTTTDEDLELMGCSVVEALERGISEAYKRLPTEEKFPESNCN